MKNRLAVIIILCLVLTAITAGLFSIDAQSAKWREDTNINELLKTACERDTEEFMSIYDVKHIPYVAIFAKFNTDTRLMEFYSHNAMKDMQGMVITIDNLEASFKIAIKKAYSMTGLLGWKFDTQDNIDGEEYKTSVYMSPGGKVLMRYLPYHEGGDRYVIISFEEDDYVKRFIKK